MWGGTGDLYGNTVAGIWRTPHFVMLPRKHRKLRVRAKIRHEWILASDFCIT
jgi:hypothetical protein